MNTGIVALPTAHLSDWLGSAFESTTRSRSTT
jgi:hypothetical protein